MPFFVPRFVPPDFLPPRLAGRQEIVGIGGEMSVPVLLTAYRQGIFPWPHADFPLLWFCPAARAVLDFDRLRVPPRLARLRRNTPLTFSLDRNFAAVLSACRDTPRPGSGGTWITPDIVDAYQRLHAAGYAHSVEVWDEAGALVGGLYGVSVGGLFSGESMFHTVGNASKLALLFLVEHLSAQGAAWIDIQQLTPHMEALGAHELPRAVFLDRLAAAQAMDLKLFPL